MRAGVRRALFNNSHPINLTTLSPPARSQYPITRYQPVLFVADSLESAKERMLAFCDTGMERPFRVRYNALTHSVSADRAVLRDAYFNSPVEY